MMQQPEQQPREASATSSELTLRELSPSSPAQSDTNTDEFIDRLFGSDSGSDDDDDDELLLLGPVLYQLRHSGLTAEFVSQFTACRRSCVPALLVEGADPSAVAPSAVLDSLQLTGAERVAAEAEAGCELASAMLRKPRAISAAACAALRSAVDQGLEISDQCRGRDSVDHATEFQLNLTVAELGMIVRAVSDLLFTPPIQTSDSKNLDRR
jgi:hypothetical protein